jgi:hypothetical protein
MNLLILLVIFVARVVPHNKYKSRIKNKDIVLFSILILILNYVNNLKIILYYFLIYHLQ